MLLDATLCYATDYTDYTENNLWKSAKSAVKMQQTISCKKKAYEISVLFLYKGERKPVLRFTVVYFALFRMIYESTFR